MSQHFLMGYKLLEGSGGETVLCTYSEFPQRPPPAPGLNPGFNLHKCLLNNGWMDGWMGGWVGGWVDGWMGGWVGGWMDGWEGGWVDGWID